MGVFSEIQIEIQDRAIKEACALLRVVQNGLRKQQAIAEEYAAKAKAAKVYATGNRMEGRAFAYLDAANMITAAIDAINDGDIDGDI